MAGICLSAWYSRCSPTAAGGLEVDWLRSHDPCLLHELRRSNLLKGEVARFREVQFEGRKLYLHGDQLLTIDQIAASLVKIPGSNLLSDQEPPPTKYIDHYRAVSIPNPRRDTDKKLGLSTQGWVIWKRGTVLNYAVKRGSFGAMQDPATEDKYRSMVQYVATAAGAWSDVSGIAFNHLGELDGGALGPNWWVEHPTLDFLVEVADFGGGDDVYASAFYPTWEPFRQRILISPHFFGQGSHDPIGLIRHELGHIHGFVDENVRSPLPGGLTDYDRHSVMYLDNNYKLDINANDLKAIASVYRR